MQVRVGDLLNAELVKHLVVCLGLHALKLVNRDLPVVNRNEVYKILVLLDIHFELLNRCGV